MRGWLSCCGLLAACGRVGFATDGSDATISVDAVDLAVLDVPFGTPVAVPELAHPASDYDPELSTDQRTIYFGSSRAGGMAQLWRATRASTAGAWSSPELIPELATGFRDLDPAISRDGLALVFSTTRNNETRPRLYATARPTLSSPFAPPVRIDELVTAGEEVGPYLSDDGLTLYFHAGPVDAFDLYAATRSEPGAQWGAMEALPGLASAIYSDSDPMLTAGGRVLVFSSNRAAPPDLDLWIATRASDSEPFGTPVPLSELNTTFVDSSPWLSPDLRTIYFTSERTGEREIYMATR